jgi:hypothetical protein
MTVYMQVSFALVFGFGRLFLGPQLVYLTVFADNPIPVKVSSVLLLLSIMFLDMHVFLFRTDGPEKN